MRSNTHADILLPLPPEVEKRVVHIESLAKMMDSQFAIPGTQLHLGIDTLIGLIPGIGDTISLGIAGYIVFHAKRLGARKRTLSRMVYNIFIDWLIGLVPIIGDFFDMGWKGNNKNAALLRSAMERLHSP
ncbi:MAG: DUF4112 domain-containing protein [Hellea sp.]